MKTINVQQENNNVGDDDVNFDNNDPENFTQALDTPEVADSRSELVGF